MFNPSVVAEEIFNTLVGFNFQVALFGNKESQMGVKVVEPSEANLFFTRPKNIVVSIHELGENSAIQVHLGRSTPVASVQGMLNTLRNIASKYGMNWGIDKYGRELTPRDFASGGIVTEARAALTGSSKSSYLKLEGARMIIRHDNTVDDTKHAARSRNIGKVMIENREGERFLMPTSNLMAGRAMTRHVSKGGKFRDERGSKIIEMATEQLHAKTCASYCRKNKKSLDEDVSPVIEACVNRARDIRKTLEGIYRNYDKASVSFDKQEENMLVEDGALEEKINCLKAKLKLEDEEIMDRPTCESVVRILGEGVFLKPEREMQVLNAIGDNVRVEKEAWENFKAGSLDLLKDPRVSVPAEKDLDALAREVSKVAAAMNPKTSEAFSNVLALLSDMLTDGKDDVLFLAVAQRAVDIAAKGVAVKEEALEEGEAIQESYKVLKSGFQSSEAAFSWMRSKGLNTREKMSNGIAKYQADLKGGLWSAVETVSTDDRSGEEVNEGEVVPFKKDKIELPDYIEVGKEDSGEWYWCHMDGFKTVESADGFSSEDQARRDASEYVSDCEMLGLKETAFSGLPIMNESTLALESWFASFDETAMFEDDGLLTDIPDETGFDPEDFNVDDFLVMNGEDFGYNSETALDMEVDAGEIRKALSTYINNIDGAVTEGVSYVPKKGWGHEAVGALPDFTPEEVADKRQAAADNVAAKRAARAEPKIDEDLNSDVDADDVVSLLLPLVVDRLEEEGYTVTGMDATENDADGLDIDSDFKFRDNILDEAVFTPTAYTPRNTRRIADAIREAGFTPQKYSGRGMMGELCLAVALSYRMDLDDINLPDEYTQPHWDQLGRGYIAYWPSLKLNKSVSEDGSDGLDDNEEVLMGSEDELSSEDILHPSNPAADLAGEVKAQPEDNEGDEDDDAYINRLVGLAGVKATSAPKLPQP